MPLKGTKHSLEARRKMSQAQKIYWKNHPECKKFIVIGGKNKTSFKEGHYPWIKGKHHSDETREKISKSNKGKVMLNVWNKGKPWSEEIKKKISETKKGKPSSRKGIKQWVNNNHPFLGKHHSEETRKKLSISLKGKKSWMTGRHHSQQTKDKLSLKFKGKKLSLEHRQKAIKNLANHHFQAGEKHRYWQGGISFEPYGIAFNEKLKERVRKRDSYRCQQCFRHQDELFAKTGRKYSLMIHHIDYNKKNNVESNLISLCNSCHAQTNFDRVDWTKYFQNRLVNQNG